ncbi:MAG: ornithine cyclodeaminase family protein [Desulfurococcales archaeon]|nr:ornithine cyclodeaminase family protein [Desulfurococcales archaeon]
MPVTLLYPGDVDRLLTPRLAVSWVERVLSSPEAVEAPRASLEYKGGWLGVMAAAGYGRQAAKIVGVYPGNPARGLPLVRGVLVLLDSDSGEPVLVAPAEEATGWRTAAATAVALRLLGYRGGGVLGIVGAGVQGRYHAMLLSSIYKPGEILVYSRTRSRAEALASSLGGRAAGSLAELLAASDVVVLATTSEAPLASASNTRRGALVASVGAPRPVRELSDDLLAEAGCVLVDSPIAHLESDDAARAPRRVTLAEALQGRAECRPGGFRVYKSVGTPLLDLAAALAIEEALASRRGQKHLNIS